MLVTDLDGTLLDRDGALSDRNRATLMQLGELGVCRVVATGRSPYSFRKAVASDLPVDFVVLSSGVGIISWPDGRALRHNGLVRQQLEQVAHALFDLGLDFMVHHPFPDNHRFRYWRATSNNADFERRIELYADYAIPLSRDLDGFEAGAQFIAVVGGHDGQQVVDAVRTRLPGFSTLRTTSPLDHASTWIEIFPQGIAKASATAWLAQRLSIPLERVLGVGNDYNDLDLLQWAGTSYVVANAPPELRNCFAVTASNDDDGVAVAVDAWLRAGRIGQSSAT
ncbi:MAG: HAD family hydrolase [Myxococcota bacterium]